MDFEKILARLNTEQRRAVDTIDGPVLVIAGPGTGKTQLLSARVANILQKTDTPAQNILCLTFTETGATNMRERLTRFIGQEAYSVNIGTYHAFGGDLIRRFPEYFAETRLQNPIDDLGKRQILSAIVEAMSYKNPLKQTRHHLGDLLSTISEVKRDLLSPDNLRAIAAENTTFIDGASREVHAIFGELARMPSSYAKAAPYYQRLLAALAQHAPKQSVHPQFGSLAATAVQSLQTALDDAEAAGKSTPLTAWKNKWLAKNVANEFILSGALENKRIDSLANVLEQYQAALAERGLYDFDDMILRAIDALERNDDLRFTLHEQYLYILLDEFQDTNAAQAKLIQLLTNNPVNEGRPNVMAVGDDDQAIYAFQGAQYSNMLDFYHAYQGVTVINLTKNYRSHGDILHVAGNIATQIGARLEHHFEAMSKALIAANANLPKNAIITRNEFLSSIAEYDWIAGQIETLIKSGMPAREIAVLAPKHSRLQPLVPYLNARNIPVRYEKRENILEAPIVKQLITMSRLVMALHQNNHALADALWPEVLSFDFWQIPVSEIWKISWLVSSKKHDDPDMSWSKALLEHDGDHFVVPALLFLTLAHKTADETCETMLDYLIGNSTVTTNEARAPQVFSPLREYYTSGEVSHSQPDLFYQTISHLAVLRAKLRDHQAANDDALLLQDFLDFVGLYQAAEERMINTSPYNQQPDAVQLMTVFKAKGLEYEHVFLVQCQDDVWGPSARSGGNKLTLPPNLAPIRHAGTTEDEQLRILFVAATRAKSGLHLTSHSQSYSGRSTRRLKFLAETEQPDGTFAATILPGHAQTVLQADHEAPPQELLELDWRNRHLFEHKDSLRDLLSDRLAKYQLSPTHLNAFTDLQYAGPQAFFLHTILRFPQAPTTDIQFGNAIHETLEWVQHMVSEEGSTPQLERITAYFEKRMQSKKLTALQTALEIERGKHALAAFIKARQRMFAPTDRAEHNFKSEGVFVGDVHMSGKIDRLEINQKDKTITVVDYKTGKAYNRWQPDAKLHKYKQQLYCYKLLVEGSHTFKDYRVSSARLEFVEPDKDNHVHSLELSFTDDELAHTRKLLAAMWQHVQACDFPDVSAYDPTLAGIKLFELDLLNMDPTKANYNILYAQSNS